MARDKSSPWYSVPRQERRKRPIELTLTDEARSELDAMAKESACSRSVVVEGLIRKRRKMPELPKTGSTT